MIIVKNRIKKAQTKICALIKTKEKGSDIFRKSYESTNAQSVLLPPEHV